MSVAAPGPSERDEAPEYDYRRETARVFDDAVGEVERCISEAGFSVRVIHDIQATLAAKGFKVRPIRIYEIEGCSGSLPALGEEADAHALALLMPCRVNVFEENDRTFITALRPTIMCRLFPEDDLEPLARDLERILLALVDDAA